MITRTSVEAQDRFGQLLDTVQREIVSPLEMDELLDSRRKRSKALADLETWSAQAQKSLSPAQAAAAEALTDEDVTRMVHKARPVHETR